MSFAIKYIGEVSWMPKQAAGKLPESKKSNDIYMQADIIDQVNTNQQSNMTLSAYSVITQSDSAVKINSAGGNEATGES